MAADAQMKRLETEVHEKCVERRRDRAEVAHKMGGALRDVRQLSESLGVAQTVVRFIGLDETREFIGVGLPVEITRVDDTAADLGGVAVHVFCRGVGDDIAPELERTT